MRRVAIYTSEAPGRSGRATLDCQVAGMVAQVARQPGWQHVASTWWWSTATGGCRPTGTNRVRSSPNWARPA